MKIAVVDTNIVAAGLITKRTASPVARVLDAVLTGEIGFAVSESLLAEYDHVLRRPKLRALHRLSSGEIDTILLALAQHAIVLGPAIAQLRAPGAGDQHLWDLLAHREDLVLVSGDGRLLASSDFPGRIQTPAQFIASRT